MTDERKPNPDERLADFTDRLMAGETADQAAGSDAGRELARLQETVLRTRRVLQAPQPEAAVRNRIRSRLAAEWLKSGPQAENKKEWLPARKKNQQFFVRLAAVIAVLAIAAVLVAPKIEPVLTGTAQSKGGVMLIGGIVLIVLVLILIWPTRKS